MTTTTIPARSTVRLDNATRGALATILSAIKAPHISLSVSDGIRAAIIHAAATIAATGCLPA